MLICLRQSSGNPPFGIRTREQEINEDSGSAILMTPQITRKNNVKVLMTVL